MSIELPVVNPVNTDQRRTWVVALVGNPNAGKTTLFNRLTGIRAKTSNFSGTTIERHAGHFELDNHQIELIDLPGLYALTSANAEEVIAQQVLSRAAANFKKGSSSLDSNSKSNDPISSNVDNKAFTNSESAFLESSSKNEHADLAIVVIDSTNLARNLFLTSEVRETGLPMIVLLNMADIARSEGIVLDPHGLSEELTAPVIPVSARTGEGIEEFQKVLTQELTKLEAAGNVVSLPVINECGMCRGCSHRERYDWAEKLASGVTISNRHLTLERTEKIDRYVTHPVLGIFIFAAVMALLFITLFSVAQYPMSWIESLVGLISSGLNYLIPDGLFQSLLVEGIVAGVGGVIIFLPQISLLFFLLSLLEDTGYLSRAALMMDRLMKKVGLPGKAFVPMLSAHACAIPAIMSARVIEDKRDRLVTIMILPLLTCSARLPVYTLITAILFASQPVYAGIAMLLAYSLGIITALIVALVLKKTAFKGNSSPILIELPSYKRPSFRNAIYASMERGWVFIKDAGTTILIVSIILWGLLHFPRYNQDQLHQFMTENDLHVVHELETKMKETESISDNKQKQEVQNQIQLSIKAIEKKYAFEHSVGGRAGKFIEPVFRPLGFDWRIDIGVVSSFAAREVLNSTMSIIFGQGEVGGEDSSTLAATLKEAKRSDGTQLFTLPASLSLFVFYILAMQCIPTQVVTARETGSWRYAFYQFLYMSVLAYTAALIVYQVSSLIFRQT